MTNATKALKQPRKILSASGRVVPSEVEAEPAPQDDPAATAAEVWIARLRSLWVFGLYLATFAAIYFLAYAVRFDGAIPLVMWQTAVATLPLVLGAKLFAILATGTHRVWWRYATFTDLATLAEMTTIGSLGAWAVCSMIPSPARLPVSILLIDWAGTALFLFGARAATRLLRERYDISRNGRVTQRVLIVGAGDAGETLIRKLRSAPHLEMTVVGLVDPSSLARGRIVAGSSVLGVLGDIPALVARHGIQIVLVPHTTLPVRTLRDLSAECDAIGVKLQIVPDFEAILSGGLTFQPRDVAIHDLLCRAPVRLEMDEIRGFLQGRVVMVTGASGSIGSEICRQVLAFHPSRLIALDHNENGVFYLERELDLEGSSTDFIPCLGSITDAKRIRNIMAEYAPEVVLHAAAHKHVPMMEHNPGEAVKNNVFGTRILVEESIRAGVDSFVMISTDKAVNPTSAMGACKRVAEMVVQAHSGLTKTRLVTVRFGNVLGSTGSVFPIFREQIRQGGPITVTHPDITRYFMTIPEAAQLVLQAGAFGNGGEIFVLDMGEPVRIVDLAREMIRLSGLREGREIEIVYTGLRPGEKLYEELFDEGEVRISTPHPKIQRVRQRAIDSEHLGKQLEHLLRLVDRPAEEVVAQIQQIVPEYRPNRAEFTRLIRASASTPLALEVA